MADLAYHFYQAQAQALALEQFAHAIEAASHLPDSNLIPLYRARGQAHDCLGHFESAQSDFDQALETARASQNSQAEWQSLMVLGTLWTGRDYTRAYDFFQRALDLAQMLADPQKYARSQNRLANWLVNAGQPAVAITMYEETLALVQQLGDTHSLALTLEDLALATALYGDQRQSVTYYDQAIPLLRTVGDKRSVAAWPCGAALSVPYSLKRPAVHTGPWPPVSRIWKKRCGWPMRSSGEA